MKNNSRINENIGDLVDNKDNVIQHHLPMASTGYIVEPLREERQPEYRPVGQFVHETPVTLNMIYDYVTNTFVNLTGDEATG